MNLPYVLFALRIVSALLLLAFVGVIAWLLYQDLKAASAAENGRQRQYGRLLIVGNQATSSQPDVEFPLYPVTSIGRAQTNTLVLDDEYASNEHALIALRGSQWWLEDLGSRNGTLLNDLPLDKEAVVTAGDTVTVGRTTLRIEF